MRVAVVEFAYLRGMLSKDLIPGNSYARRTRRGLIKVTVVETSPEICGRGKVRVRVEEGVSKGKEIPVLCRDIVAPWGKDPAPRKTPPGRKTVWLGWPPSAGDSVRIRGQGRLEWVVTCVDDGSYELETDVFTRLQRRVEPLENLEPAVTEREQEAQVADTVIDGLLPPVPAAEGANADDEPAFTLVESSGDGALASVVDSLLFSPSCLEQYGRLFARKVKSEDLSESLRRTLISQGHLFRRRPGAPGARDEYVRIRVPQRFDVILRRSPSAGEGITVDRLIDKRRRRRRAA